MPITTCEAARQ